MNEKNIVLITLVTSLQQQMILTFTCSYYLSPCTTALHKGCTATKAHPKSSRQRPNESLTNDVYKTT